MPLFKRTPFPLVDSPKDLEPDELIFQVRFTKEIFREYQEYIDRINLYRRRVWTCKVTGKSNLTYEEALVSEQRATEKVQQFPKELMAPVLHIIQFSTLTLRDLLSTVNKRLQDRLPEGLELYARKDKSVVPCKILKILEEADNICYEVAWIDEDKKLSGKSVVNADDLVRKKLPFSREVLKSFIKESTCQSTPWVVHENLAKEHGVPTEIPMDLLDDSPSDAEGENFGSNNRRKKKNGNRNSPLKRTPERDSDDHSTGRKKAKKEEPIIYPIDDVLVLPGVDDPLFTERPSLSKDFNVQVDCVGDLLMVWDFCSSFSTLLHLSPFSLDDFENAICDKNTNLTLIMESHSAMFQLLIKEGGEYFEAIQKKKRKSKITLLTWTEYLCDFLEIDDKPELSTSLATIKRGHYGFLEPSAKLAILRELVDEAISTNIFRDQLDECIEQRQALASTKRELALERGRKRREEKLLKAESNGKEGTKGNISEKGGKLGSSENGHNGRQNGDVPSEGNNHPIVYKRKNASGNKESKEPPSNGEHKEAVKRRKGKKKEISDEHKKELIEREIEKRFVRTSPLGKDKNYSRYWFFRRDGRLFVESSDSKLWGYYSTKEELDALMGSLNPKGERERALKEQLEKCYDKICAGLRKRSRDIASKAAIEEAVVRRSVRVRAPPRENPAMAFLRYVNKLKES